jgi:hypothetical protein
MNLVMLMKRAIVSITLLSDVNEYDCIVLVMLMKRFIFSDVHKIGK